MSRLFLCTTMNRRDADGDDVTCDMIIFFRVTHYVAGSRATWHAPSDPAEYEFEVDDIQFDSGRACPNTPPDDAPWPLTDNEDATLRVWFDANYEQAWVVAYENHDDGPDPDRLRDERIDRQMEERL